jgi:heptaprenyl diphosphate synthase
MTRSITDRQLALFAALAVGVHLLEAGLPTPIPGVKPGLANVVTLVVLLRYGLRAAAWVTALRVVAGGLLLGTLLGPTFILSAAGAAGALGALSLAHAFGRRALGPVGYAVPAALAHVGAQLVVAYAAFIPHAGLWRLAPVLLGFAIAGGIATGIIAAAIVDRLAVRADAR